MKSRSLNISGKIEPKAIALYNLINQATASLGIRYVVVGATARDIVLHYGYGAKIKRATTDVDFGIQVSDWSAFEALKTKLVALGFSEAKAQHRLYSQDGTQIDIVPFGKLEDEQAKIKWPPKGEAVMTVLGFQEACDYSESVRIRDNPVIDIPVATTQGITLLKLVAWLDRAVENRSRDAKDLLYLLKNNEEIPTVVEAMYEDQKLMEKYDWDNTLAAAFLLGNATAEIAGTKTKGFLKDLLSENEVLRDKLVEEMCDEIETDFARNKELFAAFVAGYKPSIN
jgi:predicted nucleotidyltransferase